MLSPKRTKYRKQHKAASTHVQGRTTLNFGSYGLKALQPERITARQIESARRAITRAMKRAGRYGSGFFRTCPVSTKPAEVRMARARARPNFGSRACARPDHVRNRRITAELAKER